MQSPYLFSQVRNRMISRKELASFDKEEFMQEIDELQDINKQLSDTFFEFHSERLNLAPVAR